MPARSRRAEEDRTSPSGSQAAGRFGPGAYANWRGTSLGTITETLERRLILELAGDVRGRTVLDVGCGDGALALAFRQRGAARVVGCDPDPRMIARAAAEADRQNEEIGYVLAAAEQLPFGEQSFDIVSIITVLAFVPPADLALREIARVLRPGGRLVLGALGKWSLWAASRRIRARLGRAPMWNAARFRSAAEMRALTEAAGFSVEMVRGAVFYPRWAPAAQLLAPADPGLGRVTTIGTAFIALAAVKPARA
jgi:SAM-dependent methyltransferase